MIAVAAAATLAAILLVLIDELWPLAFDGGEEDL
jgi:hypothetical protein